MTFNGMAVMKNIFFQFRNNAFPRRVYAALSYVGSARVGLLVRTEGARGRASYAIKPEALDDQYDTLRCHCGAQLVGAQLVF